MRAYCRACELAFNVGIGTGLTTKSYRCAACAGELHTMPGPKWRWGGRLSNEERELADETRRAQERELRAERRHRREERELCLFLGIDPSYAPSSRNGGGRTQG